MEEGAGPGIRSEMLSALASTGEGRGSTGKGCGTPAEELAGAPRQTPIAMTCQLQELASPDRQDAKASVSPLRAAINQDLDPHPTSPA